MKVISINEKRIINKIFNQFCLWNKINWKKGIIFVGGWSKEIKNRKDNFECIQIINNAHNRDICDFIELKNKTIESFSKDKIIKIWYF